MHVGNSGCHTAHMNQLTQSKGTETVRACGARNLISRSGLHSRKLSEEQMTRQNDKKPLKPKADDQSHKPATHIEETARMASSVETAKDPGKVKGAKD
jgi:hypothetical protein